MKAQIIKSSVNCYINKQMKRVKERQNKKLDGLIVEKNIQDSPQNNLNSLISNLTSKALSDTEIKIPKYGLKHRIATGPSEVEIMIVIAENIWDQIEQKGLCNHFMKRERVKTVLRSFTYSYIDIRGFMSTHKCSQICRTIGFKECTKREKTAVLFSSVIRCHLHFTKGYN